MPRNTRRPRAMTPVTRSPTSTRALVTRCTTARTSGRADLNQVLMGLFFKPHRHAVAQLAARVQAGVEQVARHDIAQRLQHRLLDARVLDLEIHDQPLDALPLQAEVAAGGTTAPDDLEVPLLRVQASFR